MTSLLLTIDFINDIVHPEGKIPSVVPYVTEHNVFQYVNDAISAARKNKILIAHIKVGFSPDYTECPKHSPVFGKAPEFGALKLGSWGTEFHEKLDVNQNDFVIIKHRVSALYSTSLATLLTANQINHVIIAGVSTNMAVETTARELHDRDYRVTVLQDACAAANKELHLASLINLKRIANVCDVKDFSF